MNENISNEQGRSFNLDDVKFILLRHKWKILVLSILGFFASAALWVVKPPSYQSTAKLLIHYVLENRNPTQVRETSKVKSPDERGETVINAELEILGSMDLAQQVANKIGPQRLVPDFRGLDPSYAAALCVAKSLKVEAPQRSGVIHISFKHQDRQLVQPVVREVIDSYLKKHLEIHQAGGILGNFLTQETEQLRTQLLKTEQELRDAKSKVGVISIEDAKRTAAERMSQMSQAIVLAEAELSERQALLKELAKISPAAAQLTSNATGSAIPSPIPQESVDSYQAACARLNGLRSREAELLTQYTDRSSIIKDLREQIAQASKAKSDLEEREPRLVMRLPAAPREISTSSSGGQTQPTVLDLATESARVAALASRIQVLRAHLEDIRTECSSVDQIEPTLQELQRKRDLQESNYRHLAGNLEQSRIDEALGAGRVSNISEVQKPSPPFRDNTKHLKLSAVLAIAGIFAGFGWAFLTELYLDRTVKRPKDIESGLGLRVLLSIPEMQLPKKHSKPSRALTNGSTPGIPKIEEALARDKKTPETGPALSHALVPLAPFCDALRDRLISSFETEDLPRKPKLVGVTSCSNGAGVSSLAAGLAASLSETGDGRVLLVDTTGRNGSAVQFTGGDFAGVEVALQTEKRDNALVQDNLYVAAAGSNGNLPQGGLGKRFKALVPQLRASDYDYILFDLPPVTEISATPRLARFMDRVIMVAEAEKTDSDVLKRATALLDENKARAGIVLNKAKA